MFLPSQHQEYGPPQWRSWHSQGSARDRTKQAPDLTEEINKTADTARQLATAVAGAVFLGLGVVAARVTSSAPPTILIALSLVLGAYVGAIIYTSAHYMGLQEDLRSDWKQRFFSFLGTEDYRKLVTDPLAAAKKGFVIVSWIASAISSRRSGVRRAFLWMFIRTLRRVLKPGNSSLLGPVRMDNLLKAHT